MTPLAFLFCSSALRSMAPSFEEASAASGAHFLTTIRRVTLPVLRPHLLSLVILMFIFSIETFEVPVLIGLGAQRQVFAAEIFWSLNPGIGLPKYGEAAALALTFLVIAYLLFIEYSRQTRNAERFATVTGKGFRPRQTELGPWKYPAIAFVALVASIQILFPVTVLVSASLMNRFVVPFLESAPPLNLRAYETALADPRFLSAILNTFIVATTSALVVSLISSTVAWIVARKRFRGRHLLDLVASSSVTVPSVVVAFSFLIFYLSTADWIPVYGTIWILILVFSYRMTVGYRINLAAITQVSKELEEASEASGASWLTTFRRVVIPLITPSFITSFMLIFFLGFRDATLPLIVGSRGTPMLTPLIWERITIGEMGPAAAMSVISLVIMLTVGAIMRRFVISYMRGA
jgi:iron(III) transport system permease protein